MLTDNEKAHIRAEELFRHEVQKQLAGENKEESRLWGIINSAFFLWFMSTIIVGLAGFFYSSWDKKREERRIEVERIQIVEQEKRATTRKIDVEVSNRLRYFNQVLSSKKRISPSEIRALDQPSKADYPVNAFPEYENRNLQSLLWELLQVIPEEERREVEPAYYAAQRLSLVFLKVKQQDEVEKLFPLQKSPAHQSAQTEALLAPEFEKNREALRDLNLRRWGKPIDALYVQSQ